MDDGCEICGTDSDYDEVRQVAWLNTPGGVLKLCITCRENHDGEWTELDLIP